MSAPERNLTDPNYLRSIGVPDQDIAPTIAAEIESRQRGAEQQRNEDVQLALAAQQAVAEGEISYAEAAQALLAAGRQEAHDAVVQMWREEEGWYTAQEAADEFSVLDAEQYVEHFNAQQVREREQLAQQAQETARALKVAEVTEMQKALKSFVESTPGAHQIAPKVEQQLVQDLETSGVLPSTPEERAAVIETALRKTAVLGQATESLRQQVDTEWRLHRKASGARDGLMTKGDIARAEAAFKDARFKQLADNTMIDLDSLKPGPSADEQSKALVEKYREKQEKSTSFHEQVGQIESRGKEATAARDRGKGITAERKAYKEAYARAEENAAYGEVRTAVGAEEAPAKSGALDEFGDQFGNPV